MQSQNMTLSTFPFCVILLLLMKLQQQKELEAGIICVVWFVLHPSLPL
jgi:hypothetical protein